MAKEKEINMQSLYLGITWDQTENRLSINWTEKTGRFFTFDEEEKGEGAAPGGGACKLSIWEIYSVRYSGGSNTEQVRYSDSRWHSVHWPDYSKTELQHGRSKLGHSYFIYKENLFIYML